MPSVAASVHNVQELVHDGWFIFICVSLVSAVVMTIFAKTRDDGMRESLIAPRLLFVLFACFWLVICVQGWGDIKIANAVDAVFWLMPFVPACAALLVFGGTFIVGAAMDNARKDE